jgi:hypothetical protein
MRPSENLDVEGILSFATNVFTKAARLWENCSPEQKRRLRVVFFPERMLCEPAVDTDRCSVPPCNVVARDNPSRILAIADRAQERLCARYRRMIGRGITSPKVVVAMARELTGYLWAVLHPAATTTR